MTISIRNFRNIHQRETDSEDNQALTPVSNDRRKNESALHSGCRQLPLWRVWQPSDLRRAGIASEVSRASGRHNFQSEEPGHAPARHALDMLAKETKLSGCTRLGVQWSFLFLGRSCLLDAAADPEALYPDASRWRVAGFRTEVTRSSWPSL